METDNNELSAFPHEIRCRDGMTMYCHGMSLRDYFAAAALTGILANHHSFGKHDDEGSCEFAWKAADYMMELRAQKAET